MMSNGRPSDFDGLSQSILRYANRGGGRIEFLAGVSAALVESLGCDAVEIWLRSPALFYRWEFAARPEPVSRFTVLSERAAPAAGEMAAMYCSVARVPFVADERAEGVLAIKHVARGRISTAKAKSYEGLAQALGLALAIRRAQWALRKRVKELTCLYEIGRIAQDSAIAVDDALQRIVELLPPAWQFPGIARARITLDDRAFVTSGFAPSERRQAAPVEVKGCPRGCIEMVYSEEREEFAAGAFLPEEGELIDTAAREVALMVARREAEEHEAKLQEQLRHADRLATIGQLAAGVAHELNEPLGSILGFAQLMQKDAGLPGTAARDLDRIVAASLHAREVIHKLLVFSRQETPVKEPLDLNRVVREGLGFLESRCARVGIAIVCDLDPHLPKIRADASQFHQVLINLVVNSIQAMPGGGEIHIRTGMDRDSVCLTVEDTGTGMTRAVKEKIFTPFFTTKDVDEGTGLGLAVVHGIVTSHGGAIRVESTPGAGTAVEVLLPINGGGKEPAR